MIVEIKFSFSKNRPTRFALLTVEFAAVLWFVSWRKFFWQQPALVPGWW